MNPRSISLILVAVNAGLIATLAFVLYDVKFRRGPGLGPGRTVYVTNAVTQIAVRKINATNVLAAFTNRPLYWAMLESTNYAAYAQNLRNFGCPEETVRDIILTDIAKFYNRRRAALRAQEPPRPFWKTGAALDTPSPELRLALKLIKDEQHALVREILGVDCDTELARYDPDAADPRAGRLGFLSADKQERVQSLLRQFKEMEEELLTRTRGVLLDEDRRELRRLREQGRAELASVLSSAELEEFDLRTSETADGLREQLVGFDPNEDEFRKVFRLQRTFDEEFIQAAELSDPAAQEAWFKAQADAQDALQAEVRKTLGEKRFNEYLRSQDGDFRALVQFADRLELPRETANRVYDYKVEAERQKLRVEMDPNLSDEQRAGALAVLARETRRQVAQSLGEGSINAYERVGGQWINNLTVPFELPPEPDDGAK